MFADDTNLFHGHKNLAALKHIANKDDELLIVILQAFVLVV